MFRQHACRSSTLQVVSSYGVLGHHPLVLVPKCPFLLVLSLPKMTPVLSKYMHHRDLDPWGKLVVIKVGEGTRGTQ